ncbi:hypothetical protein ARMSODRAFT_1022490 [Armillaria solidipes]|uniref:Uncharacterized protein n=1 Tax=Armillaria solidipes TaxID=1076256 RepID=A0A2H3BPR3_9AGAR|nr:hypothetical protein ARMSODRAFT_1022490 [Armillaria solidipes]
MSPRSFRSVSQVEGYLAYLMVVVPSLYTCASWVFPYFSAHPYNLQQLRRRRLFTKDTPVCNDITTSQDLKLKAHPTDRSTPLADIWNDNFKDLSGASHWPLLR